MCGGSVADVASIAYLSNRIMGVYSTLYIIPGVLAYPVSPGRAQGIERLAICGYERHKTTP